MSKKETSPNVKEPTKLKSIIPTPQEYSQAFKEFKDGDLNLKGLNKRLTDISVLGKLKARKNK